MTGGGGRVELGKKGKSLCKRTDITHTHNQFSHSLVTIVTKTRLQPSLLTVCLSPSPLSATVLHSSHITDLGSEVRPSNSTY